MRDKDIRPYLLRWLRERHATEGRLIIEEWGQLWDTRPDVAVFEDHSFHAYEIKSDHDSLVRLTKQISGYSQLFDHLTVVCGTTHYQKALAIVPDWVGFVVVESAGLGRGRLTEMRKARRSPVRRTPDLALHVSEMKQLLREQGLTGTSRWQAGQVYQSLRALRLPDDFLLPYIRQRLAKRYPAAARPS